MNEKNIVECLFEDIPSDSDTFTSYDDSEADETYLPSKDVEVMEVNHLFDDTMDQNDDELVEILNLDEGNVLLLPSPIKTRHSKRQTHLKNDHTNSNICRPLFPPINQKQYYQSAHQPERTTRRRCAHCSTKEKEVRTDWKCTICDVPLCISKSRNCFNNYHSC